MTGDPKLARRLRALYGSVGRVDPWVALLVESASSPPADGRAIDGATLRTSLTEGLRRLRDGDRFYFENDPALKAERDVIASTRLIDVIRRNLRGRWASARLEEPAFLASRAHRVPAR